MQEYEDKLERKLAFKQPILLEDWEYLLTNTIEVEPGIYKFHNKYYMLITPDFQPIEVKRTMKRYVKTFWSKA